MTPPLPVRIVRSAARAIAEAAEWWAANRPNTPDAFATDLESALQLIASHPGTGARARNVNLEGYAARPPGSCSLSPVLPRHVGADDRSACFVAYESWGLSRTVAAHYYQETPASMTSLFDGVRSQIT